VRVVPSEWSGQAFAGPADLVAAGEGIGPSTVRVVELEAADGGSAWVLVLPGTQQWGPAGGANPFDLTTDVRAVTGEATVAAAGVLAALDLARARGVPGRGDGPVLVVGHSQGGVLAAALASDPEVVATRHLTHVLTTGAPVGGFPVADRVRVLSVERAEDPVPALDLTPNPARATWVTVRAGHGLPLDVGQHGTADYVETTRAVSGAPAAVPGVAAWQASAVAFLGRPVRSVTEVVVERGWQNPRP
jgi:pimeloyl-ACP methyl ester carboxylesterase